MCKVYMNIKLCDVCIVTSKLHMYKEVENGFGGKKFSMMNILNSNLKHDD